MNFINEKVIDLWLVNDHERHPATLYLRFNVAGTGTYMRFQSRNIDIEVGETEEQPKNFLAALQEGLLPRLPDQAFLELAHTVDLVVNEQVIKSIILTERIGKNKAEDEDYAQFSLKIEVEDNVYEASSEEDIYYAFLELGRQVGGGCRICGYCKYAQIMDYGDDDMRHGLFCFRDNPTDFAIVIGQEYVGIKDTGDPIEWAQRSWSNVDAFHTCPSFDLAKVFDRKRKP